MRKERKKNEKKRKKVRKKERKKERRRSLPVELRLYTVQVSSNERLTIGYE